MYTVFSLDAPYRLIIATPDAELADAIVLACAAEGIAAEKIGW